VQVLGLLLTQPASVASDDDSTIKVAPKKVAKDKPAGKIKLKTPAPKQNKPGNWRDGSVIDGASNPKARDPLLKLAEDKKGTDTPSTNSVPASPGPVVNPLDDSARETFPTGRPLEDPPELQVCKICKKNILKTAAAAHVEACVKAKNEKAKRKKEQKEAREREKKLASKENEKDEEGDTKMEDDDEDEEVTADKKGPGGLKSTKKSAGKKIEIDDTKKGKKRKADGDAEKGPKQKKKKEEPKPKAPKQKGIVDISFCSCSLSSVYRVLGSPLDRLLLLRCCPSRYQSFPLIVPLTLLPTTSPTTLQSYQTLKATWAQPSLISPLPCWTLKRT
jgi:SAGA-associated factor 73